jgi:hypothetical protein
VILAVCTNLVVVVVVVVVVVDILVGLKAVCTGDW